MFWNPEIQESTIFSRHDREPSRAKAKTEPWCACNLMHHFSGETKEKSLWSLLSNENCVRKCQLAPRKAQRGPFVSIKKAYGTPPAFRLPVKLPRHQDWLALGVSLGKGTITPNDPSVETSPTS